MWWVPALAAVALVPIACAVAFAHYTAGGPAMEPTLVNQQGFFALRSLFAGDPAPGDIVVFRSAEGLDLVKRIIAVGGQTIAIEHDRVIVDGRPIGEAVTCPSEVLHTMEEQDGLTCARERLGEHTWLTVASSYSLPDDMPPVQVPAGHLFVLGDHRDRSNDSRNPRIGPIPVTAVAGVVVGE